MYKYILQIVHWSGCLGPCQHSDCAILQWACHHQEPPYQGVQPGDQPMVTGDCQRQEAWRRLLHVPGKHGPHDEPAGLPGRGGAAQHPVGGHQHRPQCGGGRGRGAGVQGIWSPCSYCHLAEGRWSQDQRRGRWDKYSILVTIIAEYWIRLFVVMCPLYIGYHNN